MEDIRRAWIAWGAMEGLKKGSREGVEGRKWKR
jgi:hypothetical protein